MIWLIIIIALGLRLLGINQSLWLDETVSANVAKLPFGQILNTFSTNDFHPPLYYWFLNLWIKIFGSSAIMMRLSSVLFSLVIIFGIYKIGEKLKNKKTGLEAAWFVAINPLMIYYGQELRMYVMTTMWLVGVVYYWIILIKNKENSHKDWILFNIFSFLAFVTFYASAFLIGSMILYFLFNKKWKKFVKSSLGIIIAVLIISPLLWQQLKMSGQMLETVTNWSLVLGKVTLKNLLLIPIKFSIGRISWLPKIYYYGLSIIWTFFVWLVALKNSKKDKFLLWLLITPLVLGILFSFKSPMLQYFRFLFLVPILGLLMAKEKNNLIEVFLSIGFLGFSLFYLLNSNMHREDWKSATGYLKDKSKVYMVESFADPVKFYNSQIEVIDIRSKIEGDYVWVIPYGEIIHGISHKEILDSSGYEFKNKVNFREIVVEKWQKIQ